MVGATGVETVKSNVSSAGVTFTNLTELAKVQASGTTAGETTAQFLNSLASGTADTVTVEVSNGATAHFNVGGVTAANEFETVNVVSSGLAANTISTIEASDSTALTGKTAFVVSGAADLTLGAVEAGAGSTVNASTMTGDLTVTQHANMTSIVGGAGDDTINLTGRTLAGSTDEAQTFSGGEGADTIQFDDGIATSQLTAADSTTHTYAAETFHYKVTAGANDTIEAEAITGATSIEITAAGGDDDATDALDVITVTKIVDESVTINHTSAAAAAKTDGTKVSVALKDATGTADSVDVKLANTTAASNLGVLTAASGIETLNIAAGNTKAYTITHVDANTTNTLNVTGAGDVVLTEVDLADPTGDATGVINAGTMTGKLTLGTGFKTTAADTVTVTLGSGTNSVDFGTEALSADSVVATAGAADTVKLTEAATDVEMTLNGVEDLEIYGAGASKVISAKNFTNVETIEIYDAGNNDTTGDNVKVTNIAAGQAIDIHSTDADKQDWKGGTITLDMATDVTAASVTLQGDTVLEGTGILTTDATTLTITDAIKTSDYYVNNNLVVAGLAATSVIEKLVLAGGGAASATTTATFAVDGSSNVNVTSVDATALSSNLDLSGLTTKAGATVTLGSGDNTLTIAVADAARDALVIDGGEGDDTLVMADAVGAALRPGVSNIETLDIDLDTGTASELSLADTTGIATIEMDFDSIDENYTVSSASSVSKYQLLATTAATSDVITLGSGADLTIVNEGATGGTASSSELTLVTPDATTLTIKQGNSSVLNAASVTAAKATSITMGGSDTATDGTAFAGAMNIEALVAAAATSLTINADQGARTIETLTAAKLTGITVTGDNAVIIGNTAATTTALASIDASAATAAVTIGTAVDFASGASVTTGTGDDTLTLDVLTEFTTSVDLGEKADDNDTLAISGTNNLGMTVVNLGNADQISQLNGSLDATVQTGIESIDLSGLSGSFGANITGSADANTITGTGNADNIVAGEGADTIVTTDGADTINLTETTSKADTVVFSDKAYAADTITGFNAAADILKFLDTTGLTILGAAKDVISGTATTLKTDANATDANNNIIVITSALTQTGAAIQTELAAIHADADSAIGNGVIVISADTTGNANVWYDAAVAGDDSVKLATLSGIELAGLADFGADNFAITFG
jgi:hypothetical protein